MEYVDVGKIDSKLQYSPGHYPPPMRKSAIVFKLVFAPTHFVTWRAEGNGLKADKIMTGSPAWQLEKTPPLPWTTVNTAFVTSWRCVKKRTIRSFERMPP